MLNLRSLVDRLVDDVLSAIRNAPLEELVETRGQTAADRAAASSAATPIPSSRARAAKAGGSSANASADAKASRRARGGAPGAPASRTSVADARTPGAKARRRAAERLEDPAVGEITDPAALLADPAERRIETRVETQRATRTEHATSGALHDGTTRGEDASDGSGAQGLLSDVRSRATTPEATQASRDGAAATPAPPLDPIRRGVVIRRVRPPQPLKV